MPIRTAGDRAARLPTWHRDPEESRITSPQPSLGLCSWLNLEVAESPGDIHAGKQAWETGTAPPGQDELHSLLCFPIFFSETCQCRTEELQPLCDGPSQGPGCFLQQGPSPRQAPRVPRTLHFPKPGPQEGRCTFHPDNLAEPGAQAPGWGEAQEGWSISGEP